MNINARELLYCKASTITTCFQHMQIPTLTARPLMYNCEFSPCIHSTHTSFPEANILMKYLTFFLATASQQEPEEEASVVSVPKTSGQSPKAQHSPLANRSSPSHKTPSPTADNTKASVSVS